jgi:hypothetical protein
MSVLCRTKPIATRRGSEVARKSRYEPLRDAGPKTRSCLRSTLICVACEGAYSRPIMRSPALLVAALLLTRVISCTQVSKMEDYAEDSGDDVDVDGLGSIDEA